VEPQRRCHGALPRSVALGKSKAMSSCEVSQQIYLRLFFVKTVKVADQLKNRLQYADPATLRPRGLFPTKQSPRQSAQHTA